MESEKIAGIKCDLYHISRHEDKINLGKSSQCYLNRKSMFICTLDDTYHSNNPEFYKEYLFEYSYLIPFDKIIQVGKKKRKINVQITYEVNSIEGKSTPKYYAHLSYYQKFLNSFWFKRLWIQQSSNVMWLINILIAILAVYATFLLVNDGGSIRIIFK